MKQDLEKIKQDYTKMENEKYAFFTDFAETIKEENNSDLFCCMNDSFQLGYVQGVRAFQELASDTNKAICDNLIDLNNRIHELEATTETVAVLREYYFDSCRDDSAPTVANVLSCIEAHLSRIMEDLRSISRNIFFENRKTETMRG